MFKATKYYENMGLTVDLGSYAEHADAVHAIKADYLDVMFSSGDAQAFLRSTGYDSIRMERATYITACDGDNSIVWNVEQA